jgi:hypothetical protein
MVYLVAREGCAYATDGSRHLCTSLNTGPYLSTFAGPYAHATKPGRILYFDTNDEMPNLVANLQGILVGLGISGSGSL